MLLLHLVHCFFDALVDTQPHTDFDFRVVISRFLSRDLPSRCSNTSKGTSLWRSGSGSARKGSASHASHPGGRDATFAPPPDWRAYRGHEYFPQPGDKFMQVGGGGGSPCSKCRLWCASMAVITSVQVGDDGGGFGVKGGGWSFVGPPVPNSGRTGGMSGGDEPNGDECDGWDAGSQNIDLLSGMMQLVVAAVKGYPS